MRVVITGATGNVGSRVVAALARDQRIDSVLGLACRIPHWRPERTDWARADVRTDDLTAWFRDADAVIHLAWLIQPSRRPLDTWRANVLGSARVFDAVAAAEVPTLVYASSVGAYSPVRHDLPVDERWPTHGWPAAAYTREKAYVERLLDTFERAHPNRRVVRLRPGFIFQRQAASAQRRLFLGPLLPNPLVRPGLVPIVPAVRGLRFQTVHADDVAQAFRLAVTGEARGAFNLAADPVVDPHRLAELLGARVVPVPARALRSAVAAAWRLRLVPAPADLLDAFLHLPLMDATRARTELGWSPRFGSLEALTELLDGLRTGSGGPTPTLATDAGGPFRVDEFRSGIGGFDITDHRLGLPPSDGTEEIPPVTTIGTLG
ncbi:NAD-dependent epimerase/dehydratase family protein [Nocardia sp. CDC159]|uniref:NAD-dependent epimerase/dehydratase family protein n=1 Tax=Nocardia pulmonis TaxID=2951408 RepID=A0A9X2EID0_9NOCA|nr:MULTISPECIES: NAD-dependent epimerase/dehydratase family protein [Nocardia]MCM6778606.1 NAD-dependent epimerase/dehydratase family protein [Nocardia pulmonis]MCM6791495.1 NAD-dependent epimerase/dehydratase family protein [Nocardia sp. CDC159]